MNLLTKKGFRWCMRDFRPNVKSYASIFACLTVRYWNSNSNFLHVPYETFNERSDDWNWKIEIRWYLILQKQPVWPKCLNQIQCTYENVLPQERCRRQRYKKHTRFVSWVVRIQYFLLPVCLHFLESWLLYLLGLKINDQSG